MKSVKIDYREEAPFKISCTGSNYEVTRHLSVKETILFIERDLNKLAKLNGDIFSSIKIILHLNQFTDTPRLEVNFSGPDINALSALYNEISEILWSYNRQILFQKGGLLEKVYHRFNYNLSFGDLGFKKIDKTAS